MNLSRRVCTCSVIAFVLVACGGESESTTTTAADITTTATPPRSTSTTVSGDTTSTHLPTSVLPTPGGTCFFLRRYVVTPQDGLPGNDAAVNALDVAGVTATPLESVAAIEVFGDSPAAGRLDSALDFLDVGDENPLAAALVLNTAQIPAGPIYVTALAGHWSAKPGTDPQPTSTPIPAPTSSLGDGVVAVVDSGLTEPLPDWMSAEHVLRDPNRDMETINENSASHGVFVSSLIRYLAPEHRVAFSKARSVPVDQIVENNHALPPDVSLFSTELHVAEAISNIMDMDLPNVVALNLSLGAYTCAPAEDPTLITTVTALNLWFEDYPASTVFAAGGNEDPTGPFWPAALSYQPHPLSAFDPIQVRGVGAIDDTGTEVVWQRTPSNSGATITAKRPPPRNWVNNLAPGCDLVGLKGGSETDTVVWSGSSFATAVSAAMYARDLDPQNPVVSDQDYAIPGLVWDDLDSCVVG